MTDKILERFQQIDSVPRKSKNEAKISEWLMKWAQEHHLSAKKDKVNNVVIQVPATPGYEQSPTIVLQGHMDMVCEKTPESKHDFTKDPIQFVTQGEWLNANQTTLGADNGIAIAMALVLAEQTDIGHPALELLFTVDEETGLTGANALESGFITGKILLNLDSEDEGVFTVGCAGGKTTEISLPLSMAKVPSSHQVYCLKVSGLKGGHSGVDIHCQRANGIIILARTLYRLAKLGQVMVAQFHGGAAHNAIPRDAHAVVFINKKSEEQAKQIVADMQKEIAAEYRRNDPNLAIQLLPGMPEPNQQTPVPTKAMTEEQTKKAVDLLLALPHGVAAMSMEISGLVETSNNLATISIKDNVLQVVTSQRSSVMSRLQAITDRIESLVRLSGGTTKTGDGYPSWAPDMDSKLLARCKEVYQKLMGKEPKVEAIHAGLECGIIGGKYPGMDMISFGPTIQNPHSPSERLHIPSISKVWDFLVALLQSYKVA